MLYDNDDLSIVKGVMGLSKAFQRDVIARRMPAEELAEWSDNWRPDDAWSKIEML